MARFRRRRRYGCQSGIHDKWQGRVVIQSVFGEDRSVFAYKRPIKALALGADFAAKRQFCIGDMGGQLILHEKGIFNLKVYTA
jgi:hypothetical protein